MCFAVCKVGVTEARGAMLATQTPESGPETRDVKQVCNFLIFLSSIWIVYITVSLIGNLSHLLKPVEQVLGRGHVICGNLDLFLETSVKLKMMPVI